MKSCNSSWGRHECLNRRQSRKDSPSMDHEHLQQIWPIVSETFTKKKNPFFCHICDGVISGFGADTKTFLVAKSLLLTACVLSRAKAQITFHITYYFTWRGNRSLFCSLWALLSICKVNTIDQTFDFCYLTVFTVCYGHILALKSIDVVLS